MEILNRIRYNLNCPEGPRIWHGPSWTSFMAISTSSSEASMSVPDPRVTLCWNPFGRGHPESAFEVRGSRRLCLRQPVSKSQRSVISYSGERLKHQGNPFPYRAPRRRSLVGPIEGSEEHVFLVMAQCNRRPPYPRSSVVER